MFKSEILKLEMFGLEMVGREMCDLNGSCRPPYKHASNVHSSYFCIDLYALLLYRVYCSMVPLVLARPYWPEPWPTTPSVASFGYLALSLFRSTSERDQGW